MTTVSYKVTVRVPKLKSLAHKIDAQLGGQGGPVNDAVTQWGVRVRAWLQERFDKYSKGGGNWPPLSESTLRQRRGTTASILRDTGLLFAALSPVFVGAPGALQDRLKNGIRVGFGGPATHASGGSASVSDIAYFHQVGAGILPVRKIIETPGIDVQQEMANDLQRAISRLK